LFQISYAQLLHDDRDLLKSFSTIVDNAITGTFPNVENGSSRMYPFNKRKCYVVKNQIALLYNETVAFRGAQWKIRLIIASKIHEINVLLRGHCNDVSKRYFATNVAFPAQYGFY